MARRGKGSEFERGVAKIWEARGARRVTLNEQVRGKIGQRPWECDVHAEFYSPIWRWISVAAYLVLCAGTGMLVAALVNPDAQRAVEQIDHDASTSIGLVGWHRGVGLGAIGLVLLAVVHFGRAASETHVWIECKDRKSTIKRDDVNKLAKTIEQVRRGDAKWKPDRVVFVSSSRFDQDAEAFARDSNIECVWAGAPN